MTQTLYFITQNGQPVSMETWTDREKAQAVADRMNIEAGKALGVYMRYDYEVHSRVSSDNASEATPITVTMGLPGAVGAAKGGK